MIRFEKVVDVEGLRCIEKLAIEIWNQHYVKIIGQEQVDYMLRKFQTVPAMKLQIESGYEYFLIQKDRTSVGYISILAKDDHIFLSKLYILASQRREGIASKSIDYLVEKTNSLGRLGIKLTVNKNNNKAICFYKERGFNIVRNIIEDIGGEFVMDDYVMEKVID